MKRIITNHKKKKKALQKSLSLPLFSKPRKMKNPKKSETPSHTIDTSTYDQMYLDFTLIVSWRNHTHTHTHTHTTTTTTKLASFIIIINQCKKKEKSSLSLSLSLLSNKAVTHTSSSQPFLLPPASPQKNLL
jgi:hypothetical protein